MKKQRQIRIDSELSVENEIKVEMHQGCHLFFLQLW